MGWMSLRLAAMASRRAILSAMQCRGRRPEPGGQRLRKARRVAVSHPGDVTIGPDQHDCWSSDRAECREVPRAVISGVDQPDPIRPRRDVEGAGLTEVE